MPPRSACAAAVLCLVSLSCFGGDSSNVFANMPSDTIPLAFGPGDLLITTADTTMDLALVGDTVLMQFNDKVRAKIRADLDTARVQSHNDIGATIERAVKRQVGAMLGRRLVRPLAEIDSVTLDDNRIRFFYRERRGFTFDGMKTNDRPVLESFRPEDARRFVDAVRARKARAVSSARRRPQDVA